MNDSTSVAEGLLLCHPDMINFYRLKFEIYKKLNLSFDLFFNDDIINYKDQKYYYLDLKQKYIKDTLYMHITYHTLYNPDIRVRYDTDDITIGTLSGEYGILTMSSYIERKLVDVLLSSTFTKKILTKKQRHSLNALIKKLMGCETLWIL